MWITEYYTSTEYRPVRSIAQTSTTGHGTNVIQGLAVSMEATALPVLVICVGIIVSYLVAGLFGIAIAATTMLALAGMIVALDAYGPVTDNAGGIAEMADLPREVRRDHRRAGRGRQHHQGGDQGLRDRLGRARLAGAVRRLHRRTCKHYFPNLDVQFALQDPYVVIGLFIGGLLPYLFGAMGMTAVGRAAGAVVVEVRRQFREIPGIMEGTGQARIRPRGRHADPGRDPGDDRPLAAAGAGADRAVARDPRDRRAGGGVQRRSARCCSARSSPACSSRSR